MKHLLSACLFAIGSLGLAQTSGTLKGKVFDELGEPLIGARVSVEVGAEEIKTGTDFDGKFTIKPLNSGTYLVKVVSVGYDTVQVQVVVKSDQITFMPDVAMTEGGSLVGLVVTEPIINPDETSKISIGYKQLKNSPVLRNPSKLVEGLSSEITRNEAGELYFRGSRSSNIVQFIDGVKQTGSLANIPGRAIGRVSVYTGGIPAKYGDTTGGVIVMETKSYFDLYYARMAGNE